MSVLDLFSPQEIYVGTGIENQKKKTKKRMKEKAQKGKYIEIHSPVSQQKNPAVKLVGSWKAQSKFKIFFVGDLSLVQHQYTISWPWYTVKLF